MSKLHKIGQGVAVALLQLQYYLDVHKLLKQVQMLH